MAAPLQQRCCASGPRCRIPRARGPPRVQSASRAHFHFLGSRILYIMAQAASLEGVWTTGVRDGRSVWSAYKLSWNQWKRMHLALLWGEEVCRWRSLVKTVARVRDWHRAELRGNRIGRGDPRKPEMGEWSGDGKADRSYFERTSRIIIKRKAAFRSKY